MNNKDIGIKHNLGISKIKLPHVFVNKEHKIVPDVVVNKAQKMLIQKIILHLWIQSMRLM